MRTAQEMLDQLTGRGCGFMTHSGVHITPDSGSPEIIDIAIGLGRIGRWGGQSRFFWPVLLHSMVVADMLPAHLEAHGLLHDATEILIGDVPRAFKLPEVSALEKVLHARIAKHLGLPELNQDDAWLVKHVDNCVLVAEAFVLGPIGTADLFVKSNVEPGSVTVHYVEKMVNRYFYADTISVDSRAVQDFVTRTEIALKCVRES